MKIKQAFHNVLATTPEALRVAVEFENGEIEFHSALNRIYNIVYEKYLEEMRLETKKINWKYLCEEMFINFPKNTSHMHEQYVDIWISEYDEASEEEKKIMESMYAEYLKQYGGNE